MKVAEEPAPVEELGFSAIRERLFWLQVVCATTLSPNVYLEAESYPRLFRIESAAGHEALLLSEPAAPKPRVALVNQRLFELAAEIQSTRSVRPQSKPNGYVFDVLQVSLQA